jgi:hypothetical protein
MRKFRWDRVQSHIWGRASYYVRKCANFSPIFPVSHIWLCTRSLLISWYTVWGKFSFLFYQCMEIVSMVLLIRQREWKAVKFVNRVDYVHLYILPNVKTTSPFCIQLFYQGEETRIHCIHLYLILPMQFPGLICSVDGVKTLSCYRISQPFTFHIFWRPMPWLPPITFSMPIKWTSISPLFRPHYHSRGAGGAFSNPLFL